MEYNFLELKNGIRIIHKPTKSKVAHCGFIINTGSRDETTDNSGITHFIEHALFKGTEKRKSHHILNRLDNVGGEINAFTTKEQTSSDHNASQHMNHSDGPNWSWTKFASAN